MTIIHRVYDSSEQAEHAIAALQAGGVASTNLSLIMATQQRDAKDERAGSFADGDGHDHDARAEREGSFADGDGHDHDAHAEPTGSFGGGDANAARSGNFADVDRDTVTTWSAGTHRVSTSSHAQITRLLLAAGMDAAGAEAQIAAIHAGKAIVLVQVADEDASRLQSILQGP